MTTLSNTEIAQLTAQITGGGFKRSNSKDAAIARFTKIAGEHSIDAATILAAKSMAEAKERLHAAQAPKTKPGINDYIAKVRSRPNSQTGKVFEAPAGETKAKLQGKRAQIEADARAGKIPTAPDFSAETHKPYRKKLAEVVALVDARDLKGLKTYQIKPVSSSPKAIVRYRDLAILAIEAAA